ncbi:MAG: M48 family metallopeptidase [Saprospiraceae bacterium]|nr:M48 family metallopeptidase [Saprospiraceae bacterium]
MNLLRLNALHGFEYQHPREKKAMRALQETKGIERVVKKFYDMGIEKIIKLQSTGSSLEASPDAFPELNRLLDSACSILQVPVRPELYIRRSEDLDAITLGVDHPIILITSECVNRCTHQELLFVFGRQLAHIQNNHILYKEIGFIFPELIDTLAPVTLGLSSILSGGLRYALFYWDQMAEFTADRGGLLTCQDVSAAKQYLAKVAGLPEKHWGDFDLDAFDRQAKAFELEDEKTFEKFMRYLFGNSTMAIARGHELIQWIEWGDFSALMTLHGR